MSETKTTSARSSRPAAVFCDVGKSPASDDGYFELMTQAIFRAGLNWSVIENKWPGFRTAFENFVIDDVAGFGEADASRLADDRSIVRNHRKIVATIENAIAFQQIRVEHGSYGGYLHTLAEQGEDAMVAGLRKRFAHVGESTAVSFLRSVGYEMPEHVEAWNSRRDG